MWHNPTYNDIILVRRLLSQMELPYELVMIVMGEANYVHKVESLVGENVDWIEERRNLTASELLASPIVGQVTEPIRASISHAIAAKSKDNYDAAYTCVTLDTIPSIPTSLAEDGFSGTIKRVTFRFESKDQGYSCQDSECTEKPYDKSWTWFEAIILRPTGVDSGTGPTNTTVKVGTWMLQRNWRASRSFRKYEITWRKGQNNPWDGDVGQGSGEDFVESLREGDIVAVNARAMYPGWVIYVKNIQVEVCMGI